MTITKSQVDAAITYRHLVAKDFDAAIAMQVAIEEYGVSAEQVRQLLADVRDLPEDLYQKTKRDFLGAAGPDFSRCSFTPAAGNTRRHIL